MKAKGGLWRHKGGGKGSTGQGPHSDGQLVKNWTAEGWQAVQDAPQKEVFGKEEQAEGTQARVERINAGGLFGGGAWHGVPSNQSPR